MAVIDSSNRAARLRALATGGTAAVEAWDAAQSETSSARGRAVDSLLGQTAVGGTTDVNDALADIVNRYTAAPATDAVRGRELAGEQVGYESRAIDRLLGENDQRIARARAQANAQMAGMRSSSSSSSGGGGVQDPNGLLADLTARERDAVLTAAGARLQAESLADTVARAASAAANHAAAKTEGKRVALERDERSRRAGPATPNRVALSRMATSGSVPDYVADAARARVIAASRDDGVFPTGGYDAGAREFDRQAGSYLNMAAATEGYDQRQAQGLVDSGLWDQSQVGILPRFIRDASGAFGVDPLLAAGLFPDDPGAVLNSMTTADDLANYLEFGDTGGQDAVLMDELARRRAEQDAATFALTDAVNEALTTTDGSQLDVYAPEDLVGLANAANLTVDRVAQVLATDAWAAATQMAQIVAEDPDVDRTVKADALQQAIAAGELNGVPVPDRVFDQMQAIPELAGLVALRFNTLLGASGPPTSSFGM